MSSAHRLDSLLLGSGIGIRVAVVLGRGPVEVQLGRSHRMLGDLLLEHCIFGTSWTVFQDWWFGKSRFGFWWKELRLRRGWVIGGFSLSQSVIFVGT